MKKIKNEVLVKSETKEQKFIRLAEGRTSNILKDIKLLSNLSETKNYSFSQEQVQKIFSSIKKELNQAENNFKKVFQKETLFKL